MKCEPFSVVGICDLVGWDWIDGRLVRVDVQPITDDFERDCADFLPLD